MNVQENERTSFRRVLPLLAPVALAGLAATLASLTALVLDPPPASTWAALAAVFAAGVLVEASPIRLRGLPAGRVALSAVFFIGAAVMFGTAEATVVALAVRVTIDVAQRHPPLRLLYNGPGLRPLRRRGGRRRLTARRRLRPAPRRGGRGGHRCVLRRQRRARHGGDRPCRAAGVRPADRGDRARDALSLRDHGLGRAHARRALGALAASRTGTRRTTARGCALRTVDAGRPRRDSARADGRAHRSRKPPPLSRAAAGRARPRGAQRRPAHRVPARRRRSQAGQRHARTPSSAISCSSWRRRRCATAARRSASAATSSRCSCRARRSRSRSRPQRRSSTGSPRSTDVEGERLRLSCGLAVFPAAPRHDLYRAADQALYASKREGLCRAHVYRPEDPRPIGASAAA